MGHAELDFGCAILMISEQYPEMGVTAPKSGGSASSTLHLHVDNADEVVARAAANGAKIEMEPTDHFYGERSGSFRDPFGHRWNIGHSIEEVEPEEMQRRYDALMRGDSDRCDGPSAGSE